VLTAIVSDLHLGARMSLLATAPARERLLAQLEGADQIVLLGDLLALRDGAAADVLDAAEPFLAGLREVAGGKRVVVVPGNHDHRLARPVLERGPRDELGLEQIVAPRGDALGEALAHMLGGVELVIAYPGVWIRPDVYATHGHYIDCHTTVPRRESLLAAISSAANGRVPRHGAAPRDYEAVLAPIYDFSFEYAQSSASRERAAGRGAAAWRHVQDFGWRRVSGQRGIRGAGPRALAGAAVAGTIGALKLAGLGTFSLDLAPDTIGRAGIRAAGEVVDRLGIDAAHVVFGHTHRAGPLADDHDWRAGLVNCGSWVHEPALIREHGAEDPYWPGRCVLVRDSGPPELRFVLGQAAAQPAVL